MTTAKAATNNGNKKAGTNANANANKAAGNKGTANKGTGTQKDHAQATNKAKATPAAKNTNKPAANNKKPEQAANNKKPETKPETKNETKPETNPQNNGTDLNLKNSDTLNEAGNILDALSQAGNENAMSQELAISTAMTDVNLKDVAPKNFNPEDFVKVDGDEVVVNYPEPDFSVLAIPTKEEIAEAATSVTLDETNAYENPLNAVKNGNLARFIVWLQRNFNGDLNALENFTKNVMVSASIIPVLAVRASIDEAARNIVENQAAEKRRLAKEEEDRLAREAMQEMEEQMIQSFIAKGLDPEAAKRKVQEMFSPKQSRSTGNGGQFSYNRVLIKCGEHEFEMGERGFHPQIAQELWEKEGITKEEFVKKYTVKIVREGTV